MVRKDCRSRGHASCGSCRNNNALHLDASNHARSTICGSTATHGSQGAPGGVGGSDGHDRLLATLVHLRHGTTHDVLACWFGVDRSTITRAVGEVRPLLAERGCTISPDVRLRSLAEVVDHLGATGKTGIIDGTEIRVRRPAQGRKDRDKFISGKNKQNAVKSMVVTDEDGRVLFCSPTKPGSCADITHARQLGLVKLLADGPAVEILADAGYQGLGAQTGGRVVTPPHRKFKKNAPDWYEEIYERQRKTHSSRRIRVEHGIAHLKNWRALARHLGRREHMSDTVQAIAGLLSHQEITDLKSAGQM
ncbi:transposase family protein [Streptomyces sp. NPDC001027]|uniref:transposase family protein n=1 Tax=Streptomyces sp. NPDC001027 TaxID=3154771 RepID=UPI0033207607